MEKKLVTYIVNKEKLVVDSGCDKRRLSENQQNKMIKLRSMDGDIFTIAIEKAKCSTLLRDMLEDVTNDAHEPIAVTTVRSPVLEKVVDYMNTPVETFCNNMPYPLLCNVILAANYFHIQPLLDLGCKTIADVFKGKTLEEAKVAFNITTELSAEEIELIRQENPWCVAEQD